jgi:hypothetical protein
MSRGPATMSEADRKSLRECCERIAAKRWTGVSSYWAAANIIALLDQVETLQTERDHFALHIARLVSNK